MLLPGFEYRMLEWRHPQAEETHRRLERSKASYGQWALVLEALLQSN